MSGPDKPRRGRRLLGPDERRLWERVAATTERMRSRSGARHADPVPDAPEISVVTAPKDAVRPAEVQPQPTRIVKPAKPMAPVRQRHSANLLGPEVGPVGKPEAGLDRRTSDRLRKGGRTPDATIDLHGMSAERAHRACLTFLADALSRGCRVVLVITGKGGRQDDVDFMTPGRGKGVLRESLPGWLRASPLGRSIVGVYQAHQKHGGAGAFYVYLKKRR
ncbi:MAG: Smr/MutS family protein [Pseudomonadota bacterium]